MALYVVHLPLLVFLSCAPSTAAFHCFMVGCPEPNTTRPQRCCRP
jgi:hypothetical protein